MSSLSGQFDPDFDQDRRQRGAFLRGGLAFVVRHRRSIALYRTVGVIALSGVCGLALAQRAGGAESVLIMAAIAVAACASSIAGFAFGAIAGAMLFHMSGDTVHIVQIMITCSIANQMAMCWAIRRSIAWRPLQPYLASGLAGVAIGVWLLLHIDPVAYTRAVGVFLVVWSITMLLRKPAVIGWAHPAMGVGAAFLSGIWGGMAGFPSAVLAVWCGLRGHGKDQQRAVMQPFILVMQVAALALISFARAAPGGLGFDGVNLLFIPASVLGTSLGMALYRRLSDRQFGRAVNLALLAAGLAFVV